MPKINFPAETELINALKSGDTLIREYPEGIETIRMKLTKTGHNMYIRNGWSSSVGILTDVLMEIKNHPELWSICSYAD